MRPECRTGLCHYIVITTTNQLYIIYKASPALYVTSKEPVCPRVELIFKIIIILLIIFLGFIKSKPC